MVGTEIFLGTDYANLYTCLDEDVSVQGVVEQVNANNLLVQADFKPKSRLNA